MSGEHRLERVRTTTEKETTGRQLPKAMRYVHVKHPLVPPVVGVVGAVEVAELHRLERLRVAVVEGSGRREAICNET